MYYFQTVTVRISSYLRIFETISRVIGTSLSEGRREAGEPQLAVNVIKPLTP